MKTEIFKNFEEFYKRKDIRINGVTKEFAERNNIDLEKDEGNSGCWNCFNCSDCYYSNFCSGGDHLNRCICSADCFRCVDLYRCYKCDNCNRGEDLYRCKNCNDSINLRCCDDYAYNTKRQ